MITWIAMGVFVYGPIVIFAVAYLMGAPIAALLPL